jgi:hypothetical protein
MMHHMKWRGSRYRVLALLAGLAAVAVATAWLLAGGARGVAIATVLCFTIAVLALGADVFDVSWHKTLTTHAGLAAAARALARQVGQREAAEQQKFLADVGQSQPANVRFIQPDLVYWRTDGGEQHGTLSNIAAYYISLHHGRLLILGDAGAGKTVLANQLLIDLVKNLPASDPPPGGTLTVPVRLSLPAFDPGGDHADVAVLASGLNAWISGCLTTVYGIAPAAADALVGGGWILPVLDGLDEMDPASGPPTRARAVIRALNHPAGPSPRPVVLTCRTTRYQGLTQIAIPGRETFLEDVTAVRIQPLTPGQIGDYLIRRFPDPARPTAIQRRWQPVLDHLTYNPASPLAATLPSPLWLFMVTTAYRPPQTNPARLTTLPGDTLRQELLTSLIPVTTSQHPGPVRGIYQPSEVSRWLTTLAEYLRTSQSRHHGAGGDISLHELWSAAGDRVPRYLGATLQTLAVALPVLAFSALGILFGIRGSSLSQTPADWTKTVFAAALVAYTFWRASRRPVKLSRLDISELFAAGKRRFVFGFAFGSAIGCAFGFALGFTAQMSSVRAVAGRAGLAYSLAFGLAGGLAGGIAGGLARRPKAISHPRELVTQGLAHNLTLWLTFGLAGGLAIGLEYEFVGLFTPHGFHQSGFSSGLPAEFGGGFAFGLALGGAWIASSPWPRYFISARILAGRRQLPPHPAHFIDWAYTSGLLRLSGIFTQFRHQELQDHFALSPSPLHAAKNPDIAGLS